MKIIKNAVAEETTVKIVCPKCKSIIEVVPNDLTKCEIHIGTHTDIDCYFQCPCCKSQTRFHGKSFPTQFLSKIQKVTKIYSPKS